MCVCVSIYNQVDHWGWLFVLNKSARVETPTCVLPGLITKNVLLNVTCGYKNA